MGIGIGAGIGPIRVGTGVSDREMAGCFGWLLGVCAVLLLIFWPYLLGEWVAEKAGASEGSTTAQVTGWVFETLYVVGIIAIVVSANASTNRAARAQAAADHLEATRRDLAAAQQQAAVARQILNVLDQAPGGVPHDGVPTNEKALFVMSGVKLIEPRSGGRGGERLPTAIAMGTVLVSNRAVRFRSEQRNVEWKLSKIHSQYDGPDRVTWGVSNRQMVSGIGGTAEIAVLVRGLMLWATALPGEPSDAIHYFDEVAATSERLAHELDDELTSLGSASG